MDFQLQIATNFGVMKMEHRYRTWFSTFMVYFCHKWIVTCFNCLCTQFARECVKYICHFVHLILLTFLIMIWPKWLFEYNLYSFYKAVDDNLFFYFYNHTWKSIDLPIEFFLVQIDKYLASQFWQFMLLNMIKNKKS